MNLLPLIYLLLGGSMLFQLNRETWVSAILIWIYLVPPLVGRFVLAVFGTPQGTLTQDTRGYKVWWFLTQMQMVFNRLPWLEDVLHLVPGLYPLWIRLWGGKCSAQAYVAPGVVIIDRYLVDIRAGALLGYGSVLSPHLGTRRSDGRYQVIIGRIVVEEEAIIGGQSGLAPGATVRRGQVLPAAGHVGPFGEWPRKPNGGAAN